MREGRIMDMALRRRILSLTLGMALVFGARMPAAIGASVAVAPLASIVAAGSPTATNSSGDQVELFFQAYRSADGETRVDVNVCTELLFCTRYPSAGGVWQPLDEYLLRLSADVPGLGELNVTLKTYAGSAGGMEGVGPAGSFAIQAPMALPSTLEGSVGDWTFAPSQASGWARDGSLESVMT